MTAIALNTDEKFYEGEKLVCFKSGFLSQWFIADVIRDDGLKFNCCEQEMMYEKAMLFKNHEIAAKVLEVINPSEHKALGRAVTGFVKEEWDAVADEIVFQANLKKFSQHPELKEKLLATGTKIIVESAPYDTEWGNGLNITDTLATPMEEWKGKNRLGKAIMRVRDVLAKEI